MVEALECPFGCGATFPAAESTAPWQEHIRTHYRPMVAQATRERLKTSSLEAFL